MPHYRKLHINGAEYEYHTGKTGVKVKFPNGKSAFMHYKDMYDVIYSEVNGTAASEVTPEVIITNIVTKFDTSSWGGSLS